MRIWVAHNPAQEQLLTAHRSERRAFREWPAEDWRWENTDDRDEDSGYWHSESLGLVIEPMDTQ